MKLFIGFISFTAFNIFNTCFALETNNTVSNNLNNIKYNHITTNKLQQIHTVEIDPKKFKIILKQAKDINNQLESVPHLAKHSDADIAINAGFFDEDGSPVGVLKILDKWHGIAYKTRAAIGWSDTDKKFLIDRVNTRSNIKLNYNTYPINSFNNANSFNNSIHTNAFSHCLIGRLDTYYFKIEKNKIQEIIKNSEENIALSDKSYIYSTKKNLNLKNNMPALLNIKVKPSIFPRMYKQWDNLDYIVGGAPLLVHNGHKITDFSAERLNTGFIKNKHGRSAIGILKNGNLLIVFVKENSSYGKSGMTLNELASFMHKQGCKHAINLDGGSSSDLYIKNIYEPFKGFNKKIANAILFYQIKQ